MSLRAGTRLGSYEISGALGAGGMGEVYRARDTKLGRDVALKVLPDAFARDPDRLARFEREAHLLASLNHPNIAHIYEMTASVVSDTARPDSASQTVTRALVLELVEGPTLADRIAQGPVPRGEALLIAKQIADALDAAHEQGVIHRDLKPANIKLRPDDTVKVLDFGLAKALEVTSSSGSADAMNSPTLTARGTELGLILGTAAYMAPEQAKGRPADRRADVWAFGVVLFEMLTGRQLFAGDTVSEVMAAVLKDEPDWSRLPADLPESLRRLLRRCLEKDPRRRLSSIGDARLELSESEGSSAIVSPPARRASGIWLAGAALAGAAISAAAFLFVVPAFRPAIDRPPMRVSVLGPEGVTLSFDSSESAISPDGRFIVFTVVELSGATKLWIRPLDAFDARPLPGTERGGLPFWSPDSRQIAFFADGKLKKTSADGGPVEVLADAKDGRGGAWSPAGVIVFAPANAGALQSVPASGGEPHGVTTLDASRGETGHRFPSFLPDGRHFLYVALPQRNQKFDLFVGSLDGATPQAVGSANGAAVYAPPGYLLFPRKNTLVAQRFDATAMKLLDDPMVIGDAPGALGGAYSGSRAVSVSMTGALAYLGDRLANTKLEWFDRSGRDLGALAVPDGRYQEIAFSPDGRRASVVRADSASESDIWIVDLDRGGATRFTYGPAANTDVVWSPDGTRIVFADNRLGPRDLFIKPVNGATPAVPLYSSTALFKDPRSWSPDGRLIAFDQSDPQTNRDLWTVPVEGDHKPTPYLRTPFNEMSPQISPDGRWLAYASDESGRLEVYVDAFPTPRNKYRVTDNGGLGVIWRKDGKEMLIASGDGRSVLVADVMAGAEFRAGTPRQLFTLPKGSVGLAPTPDCQRLLVAVPVAESTTSSLTVVLDWMGALKKR